MSEHPATQPQDRGAKPNPITGEVHTKVRHVLPCLMLAIFLAALDQTIVAVSLPAISTDLGHFNLISWVISG